jgi:hypothetical protein
MRQARRPVSIGDADRASPRGLTAWCLPVELEARASLRVARFERRQASMQPISPLRASDARP